jgi:Domain of Unknown Function (DUF1206)
MASTTAPRVQQAVHSEWVGRAGRIGLVAKGVSYALIGILALQLALGQGGQTADRQVVLRRLATESWGPYALAALAVGFAAYALWQFLDAAADRRHRGADAPGLAKRAASVGVGIVYAASAATAASLVINAHRATGGGGGGGQAPKETARVLSWPGGKWIVLVVAAGFIGAGLYNVYRGASRRFEKRLDRRRMGAGVEPAAMATGVAGHIARGTVFGLVGVFLAQAALDYDPQKAIGIDGALAKLAHQPAGPWLLGVVAAGLIAYALYCAVEAAYRRM